MIKFVIGLVGWGLFCGYINNYFLLGCYLLYYAFRVKLFHLAFWLIKDLFVFISDIATGKYFKRYYGIYGVVGEYGQGKGVALAHQYTDIIKPRKLFGRYIHNPDNYIFISNCYMKGCTSFETLADVMKFYNEAMSSGKGLVVFWDEIQNEFPENDRNFPPQFRFLLTQNRKLRGVRIVWTSQDYTRVNKNIRLMTTSVRHMRTYFKRYTIEKVYKRFVYEDLYNTTDIRQRVRKIPQKINIIVQTDKLRDCFNSFEILDSAKKISGLK